MKMWTHRNHCVDATKWNHINHFAVCFNKNTPILLDILFLFSQQSNGCRLNETKFAIAFRLNILDWWFVVAFRFVSLTIYRFSFHRSNNRADETVAAHICNVNEVPTSRCDNITKFLLMRWTKGIILWFCLFLPRAVL